MAPGSARMGPIEEHTWSLAQVAAAHPDSGITVALPANAASGAKPHVDVRGLSAVAASDKLAVQGRNELTPPPRTPQWLLFLRQLSNMFMVMLLAAGVLSCVAYGLDRSAGQLNLWLGLILFIVVLATAFMSYWEERKTSKLMDLFATMTPAMAVVVRDGSSREVRVTELVVGDILLFKEGDVVPADVRLLVVNSLRVECSSLTGESVPLAGTAACSVAGTAPHEARCLVFCGSQCMQGTATGLVVRTGDNTMIGHIATMTAGENDEETNLARDIRLFVRFVAILAVSMGTVFFCIGLARLKGHNALSLFINGFLIVIVANVPQGLPATVTLLLTITARRMAASHVFVKRLNAIETLGSASVIASDKTGTITQNVMTTRELWVNATVLWKGFHQHLPLPGGGLAEMPPHELGLHWLFVAASVCNRATRVQKTDMVNAGGGGGGGGGGAARRPSAPSLDLPRASVERRPSGFAAPDQGEYLGSPSDIALLRFVDHHAGAAAYRDLYQIMLEVPFNSTNKWHMVLCQPTSLAAATTCATLAADPAAVTAAVDTGPLAAHPWLAVVKGAPEVIIDKCTAYWDHGARHALDAEFARRVAAAVAHFGSQGRRVIGFGAQLVAPMAATEDFSEEVAPRTNFVFLGLAALADPPRDNVPGAVADCFAAGIKVFMVTGDHAATAAAIAQEVGILDKAELAAHALANGSRELPGMLSPGVFLSSGVEQYTDDDWRYVVSLRGAVFARATPQQKLVIVKACQTQGEIVAVTGDGVNDAPALKQADIGIAMGLRGNAVAREAAEVLLMDDNFASIVVGVLQGRLIVDNLRKTIRYVLAHLLPEVVPVLLTLSCGLPLGLTSLQILSIDLGTELAAGITLAYEPAEPGIMMRQPRRRTERLVTREILLYSYLVAGSLESLGGFLAYMQVYAAHGLSLRDIFGTGDNHFMVNAAPFCMHGQVPCTDATADFTAARQESIAGEATSAWYLTLIMSQAVHIWLVKSSTTSCFRASLFHNGITLYGVCLEIFIMLFLVYVPGVQTFMGASTPRPETWAFWVGVGLVLLAYTEGARILRLAWHRARCPAPVGLVRQDSSCGHAVDL